MDDAGVRGVRFNFVKRLVDATPQEVFLSALPKRSQPLGWHIVVYFEAADLEELIAVPQTNCQPSSLSITWAGRTFPRALIIRIFNASFDLMEDNEILVQGHLSRASVGQRARTPMTMWCLSPGSVAELYPDRVLWGTDWPHPNLKSHMPDDGKLVDFIPRIATTAELQQKLLVDNPMRLYWPRRGIGTN